ncbi:MAG: hypothetical protein H0T84_09430 [Tatlockia sp.]|nr:hypothetical protein [Tatlockia sp.]
MFTYKFDTQKRRNSIIKKNNGETYCAIGFPKAGNTADTRFFGQGKEKILVVKRPKYYDKFGPFNEDKIKRIDQIFESAYRREQEIWNLVYPDNKAELFTDAGVRLVLPYFPGVALKESLSEDEYKLDPLSLCQKLLAVAYAVQNFYNLGFKCSDFHLDNVLIERKSNDLFHAYLIDFDPVNSINYIGGYKELDAINQLVPGVQWNTYYKTIDTLINGLIEKIDTLKIKRSQEEKLTKLFNALPETDKNDLIRKFIEFINPNQSIWDRGKRARYTKLHEQEGLENFLIREQFCLFLKSESPLIHEQLSQNGLEDEELLISKRVF